MDATTTKSWAGTTLHERSDCSASNVGTRPMIELGQTMPQRILTKLKHIQACAREADMPLDRFIRRRCKRENDSLTPYSVAAFLDCSEAHVRRLIAAGHLPAHRIGNRLRIHHGDFEAFVRRAETGADNGSR